MRALFPPRWPDAQALIFKAEDDGSIHRGLGQAWDEARRAPGYPSLRHQEFRHTVVTEPDALGDRTALNAALGMSDTVATRYAEHRKFDRARAMFDTWHKRGAAPSQTVSAKS